MTSTPSPTIFTTEDYLMPQWAGLPQYDFQQIFVYMNSFQIIKDGCMINTLKIKKKQFLLIGRLEDLCDIYIDNPTVSRKHAILQFQKDQPLPLLYDLGNTHGTYVNKQKLPPKVYKKLQPYVNIKFGISSRSYILRCPQLQQKQVLEQQQKQSQFLKTLHQQNKRLSKQQAKQKYLQLLENDPYFSGQLRGRKLQGQQKQKRNYNNNSNEADQGITWGISDEAEVCAYKNDKQFPIQPDVIRRLPGLDQQMLDKIAQYEEKYRHYDQIESQLNELANRQKREYGLEEKLQQKKERLQKKFVECLEGLEKCQDWIKVHIFGQDNNLNAQKKKNKKLKEVDTFSDDDFYDRTLQSKRMKQQKQSNQANKEKNDRKEQQPTAEDLWQLKRKFIEQLTKKKQYLSLVQNNSAISERIQNGQQTTNIPSAPIEEQDQLEAFMKQNQQALNAQNTQIQSRQLNSIQINLKELRQKLTKFLSQKELNKIQAQVLNPQTIKQEEKKKTQKIQKERQKMADTLNFLELQQKKRREKQEKLRKIQESLRNEQDQRIFELYRQQAQEQEQYQKMLSKQQNQQYQRVPRKIIKKNQNNSQLLQMNNNNEILNQDEISKQDHEEKVVDLTERFQ